MQPRRLRELAERSPETEKAPERAVCSSHSIRAHNFMIYTVLRPALSLAFALAPPLTVPLSVRLSVRPAGRPARAGPRAGCSRFAIGGQAGPRWTWGRTKRARYRPRSPIVQVGESWSTFTISRRSRIHLSAVPLRARSAGGHYKRLNSFTSWAKVASIEARRAYRTRRCVRACPLVCVRARAPASARCA